MMRMESNFKNSPKERSLNMTETFFVGGQDLLWPTKGESLFMDSYKINMLVVLISKVFVRSRRVRGSWARYLC